MRGEPLGRPGLGGLQGEHGAPRCIHELVETSCVFAAFSVGVPEELLGVMVGSLQRVYHLYRHRNNYLADLPESFSSMVHFDGFLNGSEALVQCVFPLHLC